MTGEKEKTMEKVMYQILVDGVKVAGDMDLDTAAILLKALFREYWNDHGMQVCIMEQEEKE